MRQRIELTRMSKLDYLKKYMSSSKPAPLKKRVEKEEQKQETKLGKWVPSSGDEEQLK
jgi:hypothetical protein